MSTRTKVKLPSDANQAQMFCNASKELRLEKASNDNDAREGTVTKIEKTRAGTLLENIVRLNLGGWP